MNSDCPPEKDAHAGPKLEASVQPDPDLVAVGWVLRFVAGPDRIEEAKELYASLGFEVKTEKLQPEDFGDQCGECQLVACKNYVMIYTRKV